VEAEIMPEVEAEIRPQLIAETTPQPEVVTPEPVVAEVETFEPVADSSVDESSRVVLSEPTPDVFQHAEPVAEPEPMIAATPEPVEPTPEVAVVIKPAPADVVVMDDVAQQMFDAGQADAVETLERETVARTTTPTSDAKPAELTLPRRVAKPETSSPESDVNVYAIAGGAIGLLVVAVLGVRMFRKRAIPADVDLPSFDDDVFDATPIEAAEESDAADEIDFGTAEEEVVVAEQEQDSDDTRIPAEGFAMNDEATAGNDLPVSVENTAAYSLSEVAAQNTEPETGFFNEDSEGEKIMDLDATDLPANREELSTPPMAVATGDTDVAALVQGLVGRLEGLESRLTESDEARERLERQVAAQSEELRVQRAAIARTQRALRSLSRSEEDQATEPALREPSTPNT
jgi:hypothetical protein